MTCRAEHDDWSRNMQELGNGPMSPDYEWAGRYPEAGRRGLLPGERRGKVLEEYWPGERTPRTPRKGRR